jgi:hypothetical protein
MKKLMIVIGFMMYFGTTNPQWIKTSGISNGNVKSITNIGSDIYAALYQNGIFKSTNSGVNWIYTGLENRILYSLLSYNSYLFAGASTGVYHSTNNGFSWTSLNGGLPVLSIKSFVVSGSYIFAGGNNLLSDSCLFKSSNNGNNWTATRLTNQTINALVVSNNIIYAGTYNGIYVSTNQGTNWSLANNGLTNQTIWSLTKSGNNVYAGTNNGIFLSINNGLSWNNISDSSTSQAVLSIMTYDNYIFVGSYNRGVFLSTNQGIIWIQKNQGFNQIYPINSLFVLSNYIFAGTNGQSVWRRHLSEIIGIQQIGSSVPDKFSLSQNYPNPFNPSTNIRYTIPSNVKGEMSDVQLVVFDILGKEIATLVNEKQNAGTYETTFDTSGSSRLTSGIYFYRLTCEDFSETKRMVLIK